MLGILVLFWPFYYGNLADWPFLRKPREILNTKIGKCAKVSQLQTPKEKPSSKLAQQIPPKKPNFCINLPLQKSTGNKEVSLFLFMPIARRLNCKFFR
jgi:hypothetical protein